MSTAMPDLWPESIRSDQVLAPEEILTQQANALRVRTNGLLTGVIRKTTADDRIVLGFEIGSPRFEAQYRLFEAQHRPDVEYPVSLIPPDEKLPNYLKAQYDVPGPPILRNDFGFTQNNVVVNKWVAKSPSEFTEKVREILKSPTVKSRVLSLLALAHKQVDGAE